MNDRYSKLRRLDSLRRRLPHISGSGLAAFIQDVKEHGVPDVPSGRPALKEAADLQLNTPTPYGPIIASVTVKDTNEADLQLPTINPLALLYTAFESADPFSELVVERMAIYKPSPETPWRLLLYGDEITPGDVLSHDNMRKGWALYFSFLEFGAMMLANERVWFPVVTVRSCEVKKVSAGISQIYKETVKLFFGALGFDLNEGGLFLKRGDGSYYQLFAKLAGFIQDGGAHKSVWHCKGSAGTRFCMICLNNIARGTGLYTTDGDNSDDDEEELLTCSIINDAECHFATDDDVRGSVRRLAAMKPLLSVADFKMRQQAHGFTHEPHGILMDPSLDNTVYPVRQFIHDWMHALFVNGCFNFVALWVLEAIRLTHTNVWDCMMGFVEHWKLPQVVDSSSVKAVFEPNRATSSRKAKRLKCTASQGLSLCPIMAYFFMAFILPACQPAVTAFVALCDLVDLLIVIPLGLCSPQQLRAQVDRFLMACADARWRDKMVPKFHWLIHLAKHMEDLGTLISCWVHERKHRIVKRYANDIQNTIDFELSLLRQVVGHQLHELRDADNLRRRVGLINPGGCSKRLFQVLKNELKEPDLQLAEVKKAHCARLLCGSTCSAKDVVLVRSLDGLGFEAGRVMAHFEVVGEAMSLVAFWALASFDPLKGSAEWTTPHYAELLVMTEDIYCCCEWMVPRANAVRTLVPGRLRSLRAGH